MTILVLCFVATSSIPLPSVQAQETPDVKTIISKHIEALGGGWPLSDEGLATLVEAILAYEPAAVGLDIVRDDPIAPFSFAFGFGVALNIVSFRRKADNQLRAAVGHL